MHQGRLQPGHVVGCSKCISQRPLGMDPAGMASARKLQSRKMEREEPHSWLADKQNLWEAQLPNSSMSPLPWVPQL